MPDKYVARNLPAGRRDAFVLAIFAWALLGFGNVYYGIAQRACDLATAGRQGQDVAGRQPRRWPITRRSSTPMAQMILALDPVGPHLEQVAQDWCDGVDHGAAWPSKIVSAKHHAVEACWKIVDLAMEISGGAGMFKANELERLVPRRRCGRFHPANAMLVHEIVAKTALGIDLGEQPRWG